MVCKQLGKCIEDRNENCKSEKECIEFTDERTFVKCEEKRKIYRLENDCGARIRKYVVDGGIVFNEKGFSACDNMLVTYTGTEKKYVFVELKGTDFQHAIEQIHDTIKYFIEDLPYGKVYVRIVHTQGAPRIRNSGKMIALQGLVRRYGGNIKLQEHELDEKLSCLSEK